jgi:hypothetical protein
MMPSGGYMATIEIHAGDFPKGRHSASASVILLAWQPGDGLIGKTVTLIGQVESASVASEEDVKRTGGTVGWGLAGGVLLGPVGLLAGLLLGGRGKDVTFILIMKDGKKMLATTDAKTFTKIQALAF